MANANPFATSRTQEEFGEPNYPDQLSGRYAVPNIEEDAPYTDEQGWAPTLRTSAQQTPDSARLGERPLRDFRPNPSGPPEDFWNPINADTARRASVEDVDGNGWNEIKGITAGDRRWAEDPRRTPPPENRITQQLAPRTYSYTRPFMTGLQKMGARLFTGNHFSMADHRRRFEVVGQSPVRSGRNTYRIEPTPWDADIIDVPPNVEPDIPQGRIQAVNVDYGQKRSWRLG